VALATAKWSGTSAESLIEHWLVCHELLEEDTPYIERLHSVAYEELVEHPQATLDRVYSFLGLSIQDYVPEMRPGVQASYFDMWRELLNNSGPFERAETLKVANKYGSRVKKFGYDLLVPNQGSVGFDL
jgi:hypothetical protein